VKLAVKQSRPRKGVTKSATPSSLLLVGSPPKRLEHDLTRAGHNVEVEPTPADAKKPSYDMVVVASNDQAAEARTKFPGSVVVVRSGDVTADVRTVEAQVGRRPVSAETGRTVVAAGPKAPEPIAAKPAEERVAIDAKVTDERKPVAARKQTDPEPAAARVEPKPEPRREPKPEPKPEPERVATVTKPQRETPVAPPTPAAKTSAALDSEVFFHLGSSSLSNKANLERAVRWLKSNPDVTAEIEGHADPTGSHDGNMTLSQSRADSVRDYLVQAGIDGSRLHVTAYGDTRLKYGHTDGRNRRVAIEAKK
jgi:outer membrane protein OmpA-like peptidoglycan-associated protein